ncbi:MAG: thioredoxin domain-containing protein [Lentisphaerae bacterium]|nr:thioredoxin domain-containing protein [Lentisphaerota bacterium]
MTASCQPPLPASSPGGASALPAGAALTRLPADGGPEFNRLVFEQSPYLLQHARNPVDWYPWGDAAFDKARREHKPIFLSLGYSTCHWCHVMAHESFENEAVAAILNEHFVPVKVDREERPDVDAVYMAYVQAATGGGGWPMSVWLTPDLKPFLGGTYYPPDDRWGRPGFISILQQVTQAWATNRARIVAAGDTVIAHLQQHTAGAAGAAVPLDRALLDTAYEQLKSSYEPQYGGFGGAPKFPRPAAPNFLLRYHARTGAADALAMVHTTLRNMAQGGMYDQLGGGFHRYSVDERWHVPHFEKMLYDQAQLVCTYLDAYQLTGDPALADVVRGTLAYVQRDLTSPQGACYSAEDADSPLPEQPDHQAEGAFYVWEEREIMAALGPEDAAVFNFHYGVAANGNVASDPHDEFTNKNVLMVFHPLEETATKAGRTPAATAALLANARAKLLALRAGRPRPHLDDKTITAWNGLMMSAFARAYQVLGDPAYLNAAIQLARYIKNIHNDPSTGRLFRRSRSGEAGIDAYAEDYAFLIQGLLDLYETTFEIPWLQWAVALQEQLDARFWDASGGGYFRTAGEDPSVLLRMKEDYDGAEPSANSIALMNLRRLACMTDRPDFRAKADKTLEAFSARLQAMPYAMPQMLAAFDFQLDPPRLIVIAGDPGASDTLALLKEVYRRFLPNHVLLLADGAAGQNALAGYNPFFATLTRTGGRATAYVCQHYACQLPTVDPGKLGELLGGAPRPER